jgi:hypothetical protein
MKYWLDTEYADYDWVVLCQLFGAMVDLPKGWPMYCRDIKQWADELGNPQLPEQGKGEHHALLAEALDNLYLEGSELEAHLTRWLAELQELRTQRARYDALLQPSMEVLLT